MEHYITVNQVAVMLGYHVVTVRNLARKGTIPAIKRRQQWFFDPEKVKEWVNHGENGSDPTNDPIADL